MTLERSPLVEQHQALDASLVEFGGWEMPIAYPSGTINEHLACRRGAAMFDVSHLGSVRITGDGAFDRLQTTLTNDLRKITPGRAQYTHLLDAHDASVLDDIIDGVVRAIDRPRGYQIYNLGESRRVQLKELVDILASELNLAPDIDWQKAQPSVAQSQRPSLLSVD